ncbi:MAG: hypothetical protein HS104_03290 [Polyangiaceae bacterium]|nr:hypothetical protein [Polyangiaceae bacterium]
MPSELILCVPGPWRDRNEFLGRVVTHEPKGRFMFAGGVLADIEMKDHVAAEFEEGVPHLSRAFAIAGQGCVPDTLAAKLENCPVVFLHFPINLAEQRDRVVRFSTVLRGAGGLAVKVESAGVAHTWERWFELLGGSAFDLYCAAVVLVGGDDRYYSCGMHHFGLADCAVSRRMPIESAADLINQFNYWCIAERPTLASGHTFSVSADAPAYRLAQHPDSLHPPDDLFHNPHGVWHLDAV